jgi:hypothetical protein
MRGRYPLGLEAVDGLAGSDLAKDRLKGILETLLGEARLGETCERLHMSAPRFQQLRAKVLIGALALLEPRRAGRPAKVITDAEARVEELEARLARLGLEQQAAQVREEVALILPRVVHEPEPEKKTTARRPKRRGRRGRSTST